jgi:hypothetical protein
MLEELLNFLDKKKIKYKYALFNKVCCGDYYRVDFESHGSVFELAVNESIKITRIDSPKMFVSMSGELTIDQVKKIIRFFDKL